MGPRLGMEESRFRKGWWADKTMNINTHGVGVRSKRQVSESEGKEKEGEQRRNSEKLRFQRPRVQM